MRVFMTLRIDQSGRIEQTNKLTIIAFSNDKQGTVKLSSKDKRILQIRSGTLWKLKRRMVTSVRNPTRSLNEF